MSYLLLHNSPTMTEAISLTGTLAGPIVGIRYKTPTHAGCTNDLGQFEYRDGERVAFLLGNLSIGTAKGRPHLTLADLLSRVDGDLNKLKDPGITNLARLIYTLDQSGTFEDQIVISPKVHEVIGDRRIDLYSDIAFSTPHDEDPVTKFGEQEELKEILRTLDNIPGVFNGDTPRRLLSPARARNALRRNALGIKRFRDVRIPLEDGSYVLADVFRPSAPGQYPVIMNCGVYGRAFNHYSIGNDEEMEHHEELEDDYFFGNASGQVYENHETVNTAVWVPKGYCVIRVDGPGTGKNPGRVEPWGIATAKAFHDAIQWAGEQPWSNGNVGLWGMSYYAVSQHAAASLQPSHLKAMIAIGTDVDLYEEIAYTGGIFNEGFFPFWYDQTIAPAICGEPTGRDFIEILKSHPFKDSDPALTYGPEARLFMSPDMNQINVPLWAVGITNHQFNFHQLGTSEAFMRTSTPHKRFDVWEDWFTKAYSAEAVADHAAFFDYWLKGIDNGIMRGPKVRLEIRTGDGASFVQGAEDWPVPNTAYSRWYFDCSTKLDGLHRGGSAPYRILTDMPPSESGQVEFTADTRPSGRDLDRRTTGMSFLSKPVARDMMLAGYGKAKVWVSSSNSDMDIYLSIRVIDENGYELDYSGPTTMAFGARIKPAMKGWLKVSHRKIDPARSTEYSVKHTHLKADYQPLTPGEVVPVEIEISPNTALVREGYRIRVDVQPHDGWAHGIAPHEYNEEYHKGAVNRIYTGPERVGYIQLPVIG